MDENEALLRNIFADLDGKRMPYEQIFYPPRPAWAPLKPAAVLGSWDARNRSRAKVNSRLYAHLPFCERICHFCGFNVIPYQGEAQVDGYLDALIKEMRIISPHTGNMSFNQLCIGGGTPSLLTPAQFRRFFAAIAANFSRVAKGFATEMECHPGSLTPEKIKTLAACGVTHLALGIQSLNQEVLALNGRTQDSRRVHEVYKAVRDSGIPYVAAEMMCGLKGQTEAIFLKDIETVLKWRPSRIFLFDFQACSKLHDSCGYTKERGMSVHKMWNKAADMVKKEGYDVHGHFATIDRGGRDWPDSFDNTMAGESIVGLGTGAISHAFGKCRYQNVLGLGEYLSRTGAGVLPVGAGVKLSASDNMRYFVLDCLLSTGGHLDRAEFATIFGRSPETVFRKELKYLLGRKVLAKIKDSYYVCDPESASYELPRWFYGRELIAALKANYVPAGGARLFESDNPRLAGQIREKDLFAPVNLTGPGDSDKAFLAALSAVTARGQDKLALMVSEKNLAKAGLYAKAAMRRLIKGAWLIYSSDRPAKVSAQLGKGSCFSRFYAVMAENKFADFLKKWGTEFKALKAGKLELGIIFAAHKGNKEELRGAFDWARGNGLEDFVVLQPCLCDPALLARIGGARGVLSLDGAAGLVAQLGRSAGLTAPSLTLNHLPLCSRDHADVKKFLKRSEMLDICADKKIKSLDCLNCLGSDACEGLDVSYTRQFKTP
ncbi:MAG TPA: coproporphyrinogen-III oxidase family protein [Elusimicrobiales bacterium]|nr:coproporphyrinogen-III oxidase family protein [Elusimicrobiales bacterium]